MFRKIALMLALALMSASVMAQVHVSGYTRKDGTYVQPYVRSGPNSTKADNYGPSQPSTYGSSYAPAYVSPYARDKDGDGISNQNDNDDDDDGISDDYDANP